MADSAEQELQEAEDAYRRVQREGGHGSELRDARRRLAAAQDAVAAAGTSRAREPQQAAEQAPKAVKKSSKDS